jgi:hypothetical protein
VDERAGERRFFSRFEVHGQGESFALKTVPGSERENDGREAAVATSASQNLDALALTLSLSRWERENRFAGSVYCFYILRRRARRVWSHTHV